MGTLTKKEQFVRPPKELIEQLRAFTTPELCDGAGLYHSMDYQIKPWIGRTKIVGPAVTVDVPSGEVCVRPGDIVIGDVNGVCVISQEEAEAVIERALKKIEKQKYTLAEMKRTGQVYTKLLKK